MLLPFTDERKIWRAGEAAGLGHSQLSSLFERRRVPDGTPLLLDEAMRPVEPLCSWFRLWSRLILGKRRGDRERLGSVAAVLGRNGPERGLGRFRPAGNR
ncbi:hypothetical protein SRIMM317S_04976 [Streptomyces rimosus subsp. rimosus]